MGYLKDLNVRRKAISLFKEIKNECQIFKLTLNQIFYNIKKDESPRKRTKSVITKLILFLVHFKRLDQRM
jgi:hypothetical protein